MALQALMDSIESLNEILQKEYIKNDDGKYRLDVTPVGGLALEDISGLKTGLENERAKTRDLVNKLLKYDGIDIENIKGLEQKVKDMNSWSPEQKVQEKIDANVKEVVTQHQAKEETWKTREELLMKSLQHELITSKVTTAIVNAKGSVELLAPIVERAVCMRELSDGSFITEVVKSDGSQRLNTKGDGLTLDEFIEELKNDNKYGRAFDGSGKTGSDAKPPSGNVGDGKGVSDNMDPVHRLALAHENAGTNPK